MTECGTVDFLGKFGLSIRGPSFMMVPTYMVLYVPCDMVVWFDVC